MSEEGGLRRDLPRIPCTWRCPGGGLPVCPTAPPTAEAQGRRAEGAEKTGPPGSPTAGPLSPSGEIHAPMGPPGAQELGGPHVTSNRGRPARGQQEACSPEPQGTTAPTPQLLQSSPSSLVRALALPPTAHWEGDQRDSSFQKPGNFQLERPLTLRHRPGAVSGPSESPLHRVTWPRYQPDRICDRQHHLQAQRWGLRPCGSQEARSPVPERHKAVPLETQKQ